MVWTTSRFRSSIGVAVALVVGGIWMGCETTESHAPARPAIRASATPTPIVLPGEPISVERWSIGGLQGDLITTATHRIYTTLPEGRLRNEVPRFAEESVTHYRKMVTMLCDDVEALPPPPEKLDTFLFGSRSDWETWTKRRLGRDAPLYLAIERGGYTYDAESVLFDIGRYDTLCMLAHEGWHQYTQSFFPHPLPVWLEEGLATFAEGHRFRRTDETPTFLPWRNLERFGQLRTASSRGRLIPLEDIFDFPPQAFVLRGEQALLTYYAQVWLLVHYLAEGGNGRYREGLCQLVSDAASGRVASRLYDAKKTAGRRGVRPSRAVADSFISTYFDHDTHAFKAGYTEFLEEVVSSGNGMHIWRGISPITASQ